MAPPGPMQFRLRHIFWVTSLLAFGLACFTSLRPDRGVLALALPGFCFVGWLLLSFPLLQLVRRHPRDPGAAFIVYGSAALMVVLLAILTASSSSPLYRSLQGVRLGDVLIWSIRTSLVAIPIGIWLSFLTSGVE